MRFISRACANDMIPWELRDKAGIQHRAHRGHRVHRENRGSLASNSFEKDDSALSRRFVGFVFGETGCARCARLQVPRVPRLTVFARDEDAGRIVTSRALHLFYRGGQIRVSGPQPRSG